MTEGDNGPILRDSDRDALHILPLTIMPLETAFLRHCRMVKNSHLDSMVELFEGETTGSGQIPPEDLGKHLDWELPQEKPDYRLIQQLSFLSSYDVYSLRVALRKLEIKVDNVDGLRLSETKQKELEKYMHTFTRQLIEIIFGSGADLGYTKLIDIFKNPDKDEVRRNLQKLANTLDIEPQGIPNFLEDYGDCYLSLAYYESCLDEIAPKFALFLDGISDFKKHYQLSRDYRLLRSAEQIQEKLNNLTVEITGMIESFKRGTQNIWENMSAERFRNLEKLIRKYHTTLGAALCHLSVKMDAWSARFPGADSGGPIQRADFMMMEILPGIEKIKNVEDISPLLATI